MSSYPEGVSLPSSRTLGLRGKYRCLGYFIHAHACTINLEVPYRRSVHCPELALPAVSPTRPAGPQYLWHWSPFWLTNCPALVKRSRHLIVSCPRPVSASILQQKQGCPIMEESGEAPLVAAGTAAEGMRGVLGLIPPVWMTLSRVFAGKIRALLVD